MQSASAITDNSVLSSVDENNLVLTFSTENTLMDSTPLRQTDATSSREDTFTSAAWEVNSHSVSGMTEMNQSSFIYWDRINELLNEETWKRLEKMTSDLKSVAEMLLTDNNCLSISLQALSELMVVFNILVHDERRTNFLVVSEPESPSKMKRRGNVSSPPKSCSSFKESVQSAYHGGLSSSSIDQHYLIDSNRLEEVEEEEDRDDGKALSIGRRRKIISQILLLYDLLQKLRHLRVFNDSRNSSSLGYQTMSSASLYNNKHSVKSSSFRYSHQKKQSLPNRNPTPSTSFACDNSTLPSQSFLTSSSVQPYSDQSSILEDVPCTSTPYRKNSRQRSSVDSLLFQSECQINLQCLRSLKSLYLDNIPLELVKGLKSHRKRGLTFLTIRRAGVREVKDIAIKCCDDKGSPDYWKYLLEADFSYNTLTNIDQSIKYFKNLQVLQLTHCELECGEGFTHLTAPLQHLDLSYNSLCVFPSFNKVTYDSLLSLRIVCNNIIRLQGVQNLVSLQHLEMQNNMIVLPGSLAPFGALYSLVTLRLKGNPIYVQKNARNEILSRLHPRVADNGFALDEKILSGSELKILSSNNWVFGKSKAVDLPAVGDEIHRPVAVRSYTATSVMSADDILRSQLQANNSGAAKKLISVMSKEENTKKNAGVKSLDLPSTSGTKPKTKKKKSRTRYIEIDDPVEYPPNTNLNDYTTAVKKDKQNQSKTSQSSKSSPFNGTEGSASIVNKNLPSISSDTIVQIDSTPAPSTSKTMNPESFELSKEDSTEKLRVNGGVQSHQIYIEDLLLSTLQITHDDSTREVEGATYNVHTDDKDTEPDSNGDHQNTSNFNDILPQNDNQPENGVDNPEGSTFDCSINFDMTSSNAPHDSYMMFDSYCLPTEPCDVLRRCSSFSDDSCSDNVEPCIQSSFSAERQYEPNDISAEISSIQSTLSTEGFFLDSSFHTALSTQLLSCDFQREEQDNMSDSCSFSPNDSLFNSKDFDGTYDQIFSSAHNGVLESMYNTCNDETLDAENSDNRSLSSAGGDFGSDVTKYTDVSEFAVRKRVNDYYTLGALSKSLYSTSSQTVTKYDSGSSSIDSTNDLIISESLSFDTRLSCDHLSVDVASEEYVARGVDCQTCDMNNNSDYSDDEITNSFTEMLRNCSVGNDSEIVKSSEVRSLNVISSNVEDGGKGSRQDDARTRRKRFARSSAISSTCSTRSECSDKSSPPASLEDDGVLKQYPIVLEYFHQPRFVIQNPKKGLWRLDNLQTKLIVRKTELSFEQDIHRNFVIPSSSIVLVEPVSTKPSRLLIDFYNKQSKRQSIIIGTTSGHTKAIISLMADFTPAVKIHPSIRYAIECGRCRKTFNEYLAFDFKEKSKVICPNCGSFISGSQSSLDELNQYLFRRFKRTNASLCDMPSTTINAMRQPLSPDFNLYALRTENTRPVLTKSQSYSSENNKRKLTAESEKSIDLFLSGLGMGSAKREGNIRNVVSVKESLLSPSNSFAASLTT